jgi:hypothetical protein
MVELTIKSNRWESDHVHKNGMRFLMRQGNYKAGDIFHMQCYEKGKPVLHINNKTTFIITVVLDHIHLPIEKGYKLIGFKEIER